VSRVSVATGDVRATVPVGAGTNGVAVSGDDVWVTNEYDGSISRIDARTNAPVGTIRVGSAPAGAAVLGGTMWVAARGAPSKHTGGTLNIATTQKVTPAAVDPSAGYLLSVQSVVYDTLVGYKRVGGVDGSTLVPDLAVKIPTPTDGGLTYTFTLRPGLVYSDGTPVRAEDVLPSFERIFRLVTRVKLGLAPYGIVGETACRTRPKSCDLSHGIEATGDTVSFHLTAPDPYFLFKLALPPAVVIPSSAPDSAIGTTPIPGTGPYMIESFVPGKAAMLVRNPRFHAWFQPAQPNGYPDRIEMTTVSNEDVGVKAVEAGDTDVFGWNDDIPSNLLDEIFTDHTSQAHPYTLAGPWAMYLNTTVAPFDDPRVRRALAFAIDRQEVQRLYPGGRSAITCQVIPPNFPGYLPYCPYTYRPDAAGTWRAPDLNEAQKLVTAAGTRGTPVTISSFAEFAKASGVFAAALTKLGYPTTVKVIGPANNFAFGPFYYYIADSDHRAQAGGFWATTDPVPSEIFQPITCDAFTKHDPNNLNVSEFCNAGIDAGYEDAIALEVTNPAAARQAWNALDRKITDLAPFIPVVIPTSVEVLSGRAGNYQHNPAIGILLSQLWVT
jgi:peptide/nickel transport system substrate-binding protein